MSTDALNLIGFGAIIDFMSSVLAETKDEVKLRIYQPLRKITHSISKEKRITISETTLAQHVEASLPMSSDFDGSASSPFSRRL
ncbi:MAG: hypothetical protein GY751_17510 [Bacteroidetes bacterium]|nr:hypothetical protein [Bacteroidota bacterium]